VFSLTAELADFLVVQSAAYAANSALHERGSMSLVGLFGANAVGLACFLSFRYGRLYDLATMPNAARVMRAIALRWTVLCVLLGFSAMMFHHGGDRVRLWILIFYISGLVGISSERFVLAGLVRRWLAQGNHTYAIGIIGAGDLAHELGDLLLDNAAGLKFMGLFSDPQTSQAMGGRCIPELLELAQRDAIDSVIIADPEMSTERLRSLVGSLRQQPLRIYLAPGPIALDQLRNSWREKLIFPGPNLLPLADRPINEVSLLVKNALDRLAALLLIVAFAPVLLACAVGIRISDPGPIIFRQPRIGYKGREFLIFKFRTMYVTERPNVKLTERNDPRVFRFGHFMRRTSLDELPQLFNVLRGEMSLVGPRPHMAQATAAGRLYFDAVSEYAARHRVKPGITGWAQVNGWRGPTETIEQIKARVSHDLYYIENWSLLLDISIIIRTLFVLFGKDVF